MSNPFETYAETSKPVWRQKREAASAKRAETIRAKTRLEEQLEEKQALNKAYRAHKRAERERILCGPYGKDVRSLITFLRTLTFASAPALVKFVERSTWIRHAPDDVRYEVLSIVNRAIQKLREKEGLNPIEDALPEQPPTAFHVIREMIL